MSPTFPARVVNRGNLAVSLLTLLAAFLLSLYSLSPNGRHLLFGRATTPDAAESSPLELFVTESDIHNWPASREPFFVLNRTDLVRVRLPGPAANFSAAIDNVASLQQAAMALTAFFEPFSTSAQWSPSMSTLYRHVFLHHRFTAASDEVADSTQEPLKMLVMCPATACPVISVLLAFQRFSRRQASRPLGLFAVTLDVASDAASAVETELRANGVFTVLRTPQNDVAPLSPLSLVGALPVAVQQRLGDDSDVKLYRIPTPTSASRAYRLANASEVPPDAKVASVTSFANVHFTPRRRLNATRFDVVHLDHDAALSLASLTFLTSLADNLTAPLLPKVVIVPLHVSEWATLILGAVARLTQRDGYYVSALGANTTLDASPMLLRALRVEVEQRAAEAVRAYWSRSPPLCHLILTRVPLNTLVEDTIPASARTGTTSAECVHHFFAFPARDTASMHTVTDLYPFNDRVGLGGNASSSSEDMAGKMGGVLYTYLAVVVPIALYAVPVIICIVLLRNLAKRWK